uniref:Vesicle transport protein n=1 Tax=Pinguiococcus pyrenoidosus TaxID=172671 RepID=A0A7R9UFL3_9STRA|mmetsp:Transcript_6441/g.24970  ORF Transcript_6441/g.24970 Transcript_6441/m.24970 type:complete len:120 (+) Transcript_6441:229-588(+)
MSQLQKIGAGVLALGCLFLALGVLFLLDTALLVIGNILFISGVVMTIGLSRTIRFFTKRERMRGTICLACGMLLVLVRWPLFGMILEVGGIVTLFRAFVPIITSYLPDMGSLFGEGLPR